MAKLTLHEVRHIVGSIVVTRFGLAAGSRMLGHASQTTTAKVYSHLINQADTAAMAALYDEF